MHKPSYAWSFSTFRHSLPAFRTPALRNEMFQSSKTCDKSRRESASQSKAWHFMTNLCLKVLEKRKSFDELVTGELNALQYLHSSMMYFISSGKPSDAPSFHTLMFSWTSNIPKYKTKHHLIPQGAKLCSLATNIIFLLLHLPPLDFPEVYASTSMRKVSQLIHPSINLSGETPLNSQPTPPNAAKQETDRPVLAAEPPQRPWSKATKMIRVFLS